MRQIAICYALAGAGLVLAADAAGAQLVADAGPVAEVELEVAAEVEPAEPAPGAALDAILDAVRRGHWLVAVGGVLWLLVYLLRSARLRALVPFVGTRLGGYSIAFAVPVLAAVAASLYAGQSVSVELVFGALGAGLVAIGLHQGRKDAAE